MSEPFTFSRQRFLAFMRKEMLEVWRDPSSIMIAVILPLVLVFLFGYGVSLDANTVQIGVSLEDTSPEARSLAYAFQKSKYFDTRIERTHQALEDDLVASKLRGVVIIPEDFTRKLQGGRQAEIMVIADGSETNTAAILQGYAEGTLATWIASRTAERTALPDELSPSGITPVVNVWFNPEMTTRYTLLPGSIAIIMSMIGTLLTALVVSREWERGTMEAMMATSLRIHEMLIAKITPYFLLGLGSMALCVGLSIFAFDVPFRGSLFVLLLSACVFLLCALGQGLLISTIARSQFVASQIALMTAFLPAFMLSGFLFEISSMPAPLRLLTYILPVRYFVAILQTSFIAGNVWPLFWQNLAAMLAIATALLTLTARRTAGRLD